MTSHSGLFNKSHGNSEQESSYQVNQSLTGTGTKLAQFASLSRTFDDLSFMPLAKSDLYMDRGESIQPNLTQFNQRLPDTQADSSSMGLREMGQISRPLFHRPFISDGPPRFQSHIAVPDALDCYQDATSRQFASGNEVYPSSSRPTCTRHIIQPEGSSNIPQLVSSLLVCTLSLYTLLVTDILEGQIRMESTAAFG
ncbi:hypothetical protein N7540_002121 [Penicillium herquei]|nr:hypothetical protein N7540_002121 [Penicillium herquei]